MKTTQKAAAGAGVFVLATVFIAQWEGLWTTAKVDRIGTGQPVTVCYGATKAEIPNLHVGEQFTKEECSELLKESLPKYWNRIAPCITVELPDKVKAALISAAYNAGPQAVCHSPMIKEMNRGYIAKGCDAFKNWYISAQGKVVKGLINRRADERRLCLEGLTMPVAPKPPQTWRDTIHHFFTRS